MHAPQRGVKMATEASGGEESSTTIMSGLGSDGILRVDRQQLHYLLH